jgi:hypothetical protein
MTEYVRSRLCDLQLLLQGRLLEGQFLQVLEPSPDEERQRLRVGGQ